MTDSAPTSASDGQQDRISNSAATEFRPHHWWSPKCHGVLVGTHFEPPPQSFKLDKGGSVEGRGYQAKQLADRMLSLYEKALQGVTTLTWRCSRCGNIWTTSKPGKVNVDA